VIFVVWRRGGAQNSQPEDLLLPEVNRELRQLGRPRMSMRELREKLKELTDMGCLTQTLVGWRMKDTIWLTA